MDIVNWDIINEKSSHFKNAKPTKWAFTKEFLNRELYEELEQTYPKFDNNSWNVTDNEEKLSQNTPGKAGVAFTDPVPCP